MSAVHDNAPTMQDMCDEVPAAKQLFDRASDILGYDLLQMCIEGAQHISSALLCSSACRTRNFDANVQHAGCDQ